MVHIKKILKKKKMLGAGLGDPKILLLSQKASGVRLHEHPPRQPPL